MLWLPRVFSGRRATHRRAALRSRWYALATVLALPLTLNASEGFTATGSPITWGRSADTAASLPTTAQVARGARYGDLPEIASSDAERSVEVSSPKGARTWSASSLTDHGLPSAARRAYVSAARTMAGIDPGCQLPWTLLAGVGRVESDHGRYDGSVLGADGVSHPLIIGVALNGVGPVAAIRDTDEGRLDQDEVWDRAVGPMQFIPSTWAGSARDGDHDGVRSPNDIDDAALAAAAYLCSGSGSVLGESAMEAAIFRYNASEEYVALVMAMERGYRTGVFIMPPSIVSPEPADRTRRTGRSARGQGQRDHGPRGSAGKASAPHTGGNAGSKAAGGTSPNPNPQGGSSTSGGGGGDGKGGDPKPPPPSPPSPPPAPKTEPRSGILSACGTEWCLDGEPLFLGDSAKLAALALGDYDGDGVRETNQQELEGLSGTSVDVTVRYGTTTVTKVQGLGY